MYSMYNLWKASTLAFIFQIIVGCATYNVTGNVPLALATVFVLTFLAPSFAPESAFSVYGPSFFIAAMTIPVASVLVGLVVKINDIKEVNVFFLFLILPLVIVVLTSVVARGEKSKMVEDAFLLRFIAAIPLGIGTVISAPILFLRWYLRRRNTMT